MTQCSGMDQGGTCKQWTKSDWKKFERMGRRAFPCEHAERKKKEKRLAAKKKKKQTKTRRCMQKTGKKKG